MSDPGFDDPMTDDELMDPVEQRTLQLMEHTAQQMQQAVQGLQAIVQQLQQLIQVSVAERETTMTGRDGRELKSRSRIAQ